MKANLFLNLILITTIANKVTAHTFIHWYHVNFLIFLKPSVPHFSLYYMVTWVDCGGTSVPFIVLFIPLFWKVILYLCNNTKL